MSVIEQSVASQEIDHRASEFADNFEAILQGGYSYATVRSTSMVELVLSSVGRWRGTTDETET